MEKPIRAADFLILLGFVCKGLSWESPWQLAANCAFWAAALALRSRQLSRSGPAEMIALAAGSLAGYVGGKLLGEKSHFWIGEGIVWLQTVRMLRPATHRDAVFDLVLSSLQFAAACTYILDMRFAALWLAAVILIPLALLEMNGDRRQFAPAQPRAPDGRGRRWTAALRGRQSEFASVRRRQRIGLRFADVGWAAATSILFFIAAPRPFLGMGLISPAFGAGEGGGGLEDFLEMNRAGQRGVPRVLFYVIGQRVGALRVVALTRFDDNRWTAPASRRLAPLPDHPPASAASALTRTVRVKNLAWLGKTLPADGPVAGARGTFFKQAFRTEEGIARWTSGWRAPKNEYQYWIAPRPAPRLSAAQRRQLLQTPPVSSGVKAWLNSAVGPEQDPRRVATRLETQLQTHYNYRIGGSELDRRAPLDDFLIRKKEGDCERFASALAVLLRLKGIPARVVLGYLPRPDRWRPGGYVARSSDAHAWVEALLPGAGWRSFDGTPPSQRLAQSSWAATALDAMDFFWWMEVASFDRSSQSEVLFGAQQALKWTGKRIRGLLSDQRFLWPSLAALSACLGAFASWRRITANAGGRRFPFRRASAGFYQKMLAALAARGFEKSAAETPFEFLGRLQRRSFPQLDDARLLTEFFCEARYGARFLPKEATARIDAALRRLRLARQG